MGWTNRTEHKRVCVCVLCVRACVCVLSNMFQVTKVRV